MPRKREKTEIEYFIKYMQTEDLRLRLQIPDAETARNMAVENLKKLSNRLIVYIKTLES